MPNYIKRPEPGRNDSQITERVVEKQFDINVLAEAVAKAISSKISINNQSILNIDDTFDNSKTMDRLAEQMIVERSGNKSNFDNLGNVVETKIDQQSIDNTIDLLSKLE
jgi:superfamily II helicase